jgi:hypothetical protein
METAVQVGQHVRVIKNVHAALNISLIGMTGTVEHVATLDGERLARVKFDGILFWSFVAIDALAPDA